MFLNHIPVAVAKISQLCLYTAIWHIVLQIDLRQVASDAAIL